MPYFDGSGRSGTQWKKTTGAGTNADPFVEEQAGKLIDENEDKRIVAIIGAGHEKEMIELIKKPKISYSFSVG